MKEPKDFKYPRLYYQETTYIGYARLIAGGRLRIIYPNGKAEYQVHQKSNRWIDTCWSDFGHLRTAECSLKNMRKYDKKMKWKKAIFIGEIK